MMMAKVLLLIFLMKNVMIVNNDSCDDTSNAKVVDNRYNDW